MTTHQIWSCHVILATNFEYFYFSPNSILNFRKATKFGGIGSITKKLQQKNKTRGGKHPPPSACRVKNLFEGGRLEFDPKYYILCDFRSSIPFKEKSSDILKISIN